MEGLEVAFNESGAARVHGREGFLETGGFIVEMQGGGNLGATNSLVPADLASSVAFSLKVTVCLWVDGVRSFPTLRGSSPALRSTIFPFTFTEARVGGCSTASCRCDDDVFAMLPTTSELCLWGCSEGLGTGGISSANPCVSSNSSCRSASRESSCSPARSRVR